MVWKIYFLNNPEHNGFFIFILFNLKIILLFSYFHLVIQYHLQDLFQHLSVQWRILNNVNLGRNMLHQHFLFEIYINLLIASSTIWQSERENPCTRNTSHDFICTWNTNVIETYIIWFKKNCDLLIRFSCLLYSLYKQVYAFVDHCDTCMWL